MLDMCSVTGEIFDVNGNAVVNAIVRANVSKQPLLDESYGIGIVPGYIQTLTSSTGSFAINLPRGYTVQLSIPILGYRQDVTIPTDVTTVLFTALTPVGSDTY